MPDLTPKGRVGVLGTLRPLSFFKGRAAHSSGFPELRAELSFNPSYASLSDTGSVALLRPSFAVLTDVGDTRFIWEQ